jgi:probable rRNA maturation factor
MPIVVSNRQRAVRIDLPALREFAKGALIECLKLQKRKLGSLADLPEISVALVSDKRIADIHRRFMDDPTPTDVITFDHGEIVISTETARRQGRQFGTSIEHELRLYLVHGLLHLAGFDDKTVKGAAEMKRVQEKLVDRALRRSMVAAPQ